MTLHFSSPGRNFRRRRFRLFLTLVDQVLESRGECRILDLGGTPDYWELVADLMGTRRYGVTLLNRTQFPSLCSGVVSIVADVRDLRVMPDMSFDLVHSNSVIEHVGRWGDMEAMAREVRRLAPGYFVQTPNVWFPLEPHCSTLFFHWVPPPVRARLLMRRPRGAWGQAPDIATAMHQIQSVELLDRRMLAALFPDATIHRECFLGLTKSIIAVRNWQDRTHGTSSS